MVKFCTAAKGVWGGWSREAELCSAIHRVVNMSVRWCVIVCYCLLYLLLGSLAALSFLFLVLLEVVEESSFLMSSTCSIWTSACADCILCP